MKVTEINLYNYFKLYFFLYQPGKQLRKSLNAFEVKTPVKLRETNAVALR